MLEQTICLDIRANVSGKQNRSRENHLQFAAPIFFWHVNRSIALHSHHICKLESNFFVLRRKRCKTFTFTFLESHIPVTWALRHARSVNTNKRSQQTRCHAGQRWNWRSERYLVAIEHDGSDSQYSSELVTTRSELCRFYPKIHLQNLWNRFQLVTCHLESFTRD